jgi:hypothetical protein
MVIVEPGNKWPLLLVYQTLDRQFKPIHVSRQPDDRTSTLICSWLIERRCGATVVRVAVALRVGSRRHRARRESR